MQKIVLLQSLRKEFSVGISYNTVEQHQVVSLKLWEFRRDTTLRQQPNFA